MGESLFSTHRQIHIPSVHAKCVQQEPDRDPCGQGGRVSLSGAEVRRLKLKHRAALSRLAQFVSVSLHAL